MKGVLLVLSVLVATPTYSFAAGLTKEQANKLVKQIDLHTSHKIDYAAKVYLELKERGKTTRAYDVNIYRRDSSDAMVILFTAPKIERGSGYLRIKKNLWFYDPKVGKWERRTSRDGIGGTSAHSTDFDKSTMAQKYTAKWLKVKKLGKFTTHHLLLTERKGVDPAYAKTELFVDTKTHVPIKEQNFAASGKLMRTIYYLKWLKKKTQGHEAWIPREIRIFDEVIKGNVTTVKGRGGAFKRQPKNLFTKAWFEAQSR